jgi:ribonuclease VapC
MLALPLFLSSIPGLNRHGRYDNCIHDIDEAVCNLHRPLDHVRAIDGQCATLPLDDQRHVSEVYAKLADAGGSEQQLAHAVGVLHLKVEPFDDDQCRDAGMLRPVTKPLGLSMGDRACLALARRRDATALTTDRIWTEVQETLNIRVELLR